MRHLLHLDSSLRTEGSRSRKLSAHYAERWQAKNPDGTVTYRDLAADPVPHLDNVAISSEYVVASDHTPAAAVIETELTLARESPMVIPLDLGGAEDKSLADALAAIDARLEA
jgi:FMN-dependent NADH-azoreductase